MNIYNITFRNRLKHKTVNGLVNEVWNAYFVCDSIQTAFSECAAKYPEQIIERVQVVNNEVAGYPVIVVATPLDTTVVK